MSHTPRFTGRLIFGIVILAVGALWTLENLGLIADAEQFTRWWPVLVILFGVVRLLGLDGCKHVTLGVVALVVGSWLLGEELGVFEMSVVRLWPVVLLIIGGAMVSRALGGRPMLGPRGAGADDSERMNVFAMWSGVGRKSTSQNFLGGEVTAIMGGSEIDLRSAGTPPDGATLDLFVWMGGVELFVPKNMRVVNELTAIMGGVEDSREAPSSDTEHTVVLRGLVIWGGIEIKG